MNPWVVVVQREVIEQFASGQWWERCYFGLSVDRVMQFSSTCNPTFPHSVNQCASGGFISASLYRYKPEFLPTMFFCLKRQRIQKDIRVFSHETLLECHIRAVVRLHGCKHCVQIWVQVTIAHWTYTVHIKWCLKRLGSCVMSFIAAISSPFMVVHRRLPQITDEYVCSCYSVV